jgi:hypothetical protein
MPSPSPQIPEVGQAVRVRNRLATARAVDAYDSRDAQARLHIVDVEYLLDGRVPDAKERFVLDPLGGLQAVQPGPAVGIDERLHRRGTVGPVGVHARKRCRSQNASGGFDLPEQLLGFRETAIVQHPYQLEPVLRALAMLK